MAKRRGSPAAGPAAGNALFAQALAEQRSGRPAEAAALYRRVIAREPGLAEAHNNLGCALQTLGRFDEAATALAAAVTLRPEYAEALDTLGVVVSLLGRSAEAVGYFERALGARPSALAAFHLGNALLTLGRLTESRAAFERALALDPQLAVAHNGLGAAAGRLGDDAAAATAFRAALALDPRLADATGNLGRVLLEAGEVEEAARWFERAIDLDPSNPFYYLQLIRNQDAALDERRLAALEALGARGLGRAAQIDLHFGLAKVYEDAGRYDEAFRRLTAGNGLKRLDLAYNEAADLGLFTQLERIVTAPLLAELSRRGDPQPGLVFVFGMARSGSTLVEQILAAHPAVAATGETGAFGTLLSETPPPFGTNATIDQLAAAMHAIGTRYRAGVADQAAGKRIVTDKTLANFKVAPLIHMAFPAARMIHVRRDALDTCFSCYATLFMGSHVSFSYEIGELARYYAAYERLMAAWRAILPADRLLELRYEDVVADVEGAARRMLAFCDLPWDPACLDFQRARRPVRTASAFQVRRPLYDSSIGRADRFAPYLAPLIATLASAGVDVSAHQGAGA